MSPFPRGDDYFGYRVDLLVGHGRERVNGRMDRVADFVGKFPVAAVARLMVRGLAAVRQPVLR
jgi:hypothetical protein